MYWSYPQDRINAQVKFRFALAQVECALGNCERSIPSLSLLAGTVVAVKAAPHECVIRIGLPKTKVRAENEAWFY